MWGQSSGASSEGSIKYAVLTGNTSFRRKDSTEPGWRGRGGAGGADRNLRLEMLDVIPWKGEGQSS